MNLPKNFTYSTSEYVIEYSTGNGKGTIVIDCNLYDKINKIVQRKLKGCVITIGIKGEKRIYEATRFENRRKLLSRCEKRT